MKKITILFLFVFSTLMSFSQIKPVQEINDEMSQGTNRGFKVLIPEGNKKEVIKAWEKLMKLYGGSTEKIKKTDDYKSTEVTMSSLTDHPVETYANFQETPEGVYVRAYVDMGAAYLNSEQHTEETEAFKKVIYTYANEVAKAAVQDQLDDEVKALEKLEKDMSKLKKEQENSEEAIKDAENTIEKNKKLLEENASAQTVKAKEVETQSAKKAKVEAELKKYQ